MAIYPFNSEFGTAQSNINLGDRTKIAIAAHIEVRTVLNANADLVDAGLAVVPSQVVDGSLLAGGWLPSAECVRTQL